MLKILVILMSSWVCLACQTVESVTLSQVPELKSRKKSVEASTSALTLFFIPFGTGYIDEARSALLRACPKGRIEGLMCKYQRNDYFLFLLYTSQVTMRGYCVDGRLSKNKQEKSIQSRREGA